MLKTLCSLAMALSLVAGSTSAEPHNDNGVQTFGFLTHAAFFSLESKQPDVVDPQAFVADASGKAGSGPQGIVHLAGIRPAFGVENPATPAINAQGRPLGFDLAKWFGAHGFVELKSLGTNTAAEFSFTGLVPDGRYSLFENHFSATGVTFTPLDGTATTNSFTAKRDGRVELKLTIPGTVTHAEGLLLVYHSDGQDHGMQRGELGITAHHQLIVRVP